MKINERSYRITGLTRMLGAQAANPKVRSEFIASKAGNAKKGEEETDKLPKMDEGKLEKKNLSVFLRDDGALCVSDYIIKGFLKEAFTVLKTDIGVLSPTSKIDNLVMVTPAYLDFTRGDNYARIMEPDFVLERPLRVLTMQGPRVSVTASECINPGWQLNFTLRLIENAGTAKSRALTFEAIEEALDYGAFKGLGQWRNAQNGRFSWERMA